MVWKQDRCRLLAARVALRREFHRFEKQVLAVARCDTRGADVADEYFTNR
jgi:hypothetical protein